MFSFKNCYPLYSLKPRSGFISALLATNKVKLQLIYQHPFNQQLFAGTLRQSVFGHYLRDDFLYLHEFSSAINNIAKRTPTIHPELSQQLTTLAHEVINSEQDMQLKYAIHFNHHQNHKMGSVVSKYSKYLIDSSLNEDILYALCSILPCFWIYYQLGAMNWNSKAMKDNIYRDWIATYSSPEFIKVTKELAATIELIAAKSGTTDFLKMNEMFSKSTEFELEFFNEVYPLEITTNHNINCIRRHSF